MNPRDFVRLSVSQLPFTATTGDATFDNVVSSILEVFMKLGIGEYCTNNCHVSYTAYIPSKNLSWIPKYARDIRIEMLSGTLTLKSNGYVEESKGYIRLYEDKSKIPEKVKSIFARSDGELFEYRHRPYDRQDVPTKGQISKGFGPRLEFKNLQEDLIKNISAEIRSKVSEISITLFPDYRKHGRTLSKDFLPDGRVLTYNDGQLTGKEAEINRITQRIGELAQQKIGIESEMGNLKEELRKISS